MAKILIGNFVGCHILSLLKEICPQSLRRSIRRRFKIRKKTFDLMVHDLDRFFNDVEFVVDLDFIKWYSNCFARHAFLQVRDVKSTMNSVQLLWDFKLVGKGSYFSNDLKSIALLTITASLDTALDLNNLFGCLMNDAWANELTISNFSPTDRRSTLTPIQSLKRCSLNAGMVTVFVREFY
nr:hypothetical protein [Tanacetum cinerariifolium]